MKTTGPFCSTEVVIDNQVLLEILVRYQDMGAFGEAGPEFSIGSDEVDLYHDIATDDIPEVKRRFSNTHAIFLYDPNNYNVEPSDIGSILGCIIEIIEDYSQIKEEIFAQLKAELNNKKDELDMAFTEVYWDTKGNDPDHCVYDEETGEYSEIIIESMFTFDPKNGSKYVFKEYEEKTGEIFEQRIFINGQEIE